MAQHFGQGHYVAASKQVVSRGFVGFDNFPRLWYNILSGGPVAQLSLAGRSLPGSRRHIESRSPVVLSADDLLKQVIGR